MAKLELNNDVYLLPSNWNELTKEQFIRIAQLSTLKLTQNELKLYLLVSILGFTIPHEKAYSVNGEKCYRMRGSKKVYLISATDLAYVCCNSLSFIFIERKFGERITLEIDCKLALTLIDFIDVNGEKWYGPANSLNNCIYEEYIRTLVFASEFSENKSIDSLNKLVACLYRPAKREEDNSGDTRIPFNDFIVEQEAKKLAKVPEAIKYAILLQFNGALWNLARLYKEAFTPGTGKASAKNVFMQQMDLIDSLAKHNIPEKELIRKAPLYDVLHTFNNLVTINNKK